MSEEFDPLIARALQLDENLPEAHTDATLTQRAWLLLTVSEGRSHPGHDGYEDVAERYYSWDSRVANHEGPGVGDAVVLFTDKALLGASVIERVDDGLGTKVLFSCPVCNRGSIEPRKKPEPHYVCLHAACGARFPTPNSEAVQVRQYRAIYEAGWVDLNGLLPLPELRALAVMPKSQLSIRALRWQDFRRAVAAADPNQTLRALEARQETLAGGHSTATVKVRLGQDRFRRTILARYGDVCAMTGPTHPTALEAAHLYRYSEVGRHVDDGGLPLRRDIHRLFDAGLITVEPVGWTIELGPELQGYVPYAGLHGAPLQVSLTTKQQHWLRLHWEANAWQSAKSPS